MEIKTFKWPALALVCSVLSDACSLARAQTIPDQILLKNYRPKSAYKVPVSHIRKAKYPIIDVHSHPYPKGQEEIAQWVKNMDEVGIEKTMILSYSSGARFDSIYALYSRHPGRFEIWCGFDFTGYDNPGFGPAAVAERERCVKVGATGVGELGDKGGACTLTMRAWIRCCKNSQN